MRVLVVGLLVLLGGDAWAADCTAALDAGRVIGDKATAVLMPKRWAPPHPRAAELRESNANLAAAVTAATSDCTDAALSALVDATSLLPPLLAGTEPSD